MNAKKNDNVGFGEIKQKKGKHLIQDEDIPNSPFRARWDAEKKLWYATLGKYRVTDVYEVKEELITYVYKKHWDLIMQVIQIVINEQNVIQEWIEKQKGGDEKEIKN